MENINGTSYLLYVYSINKKHTKFLLMDGQPNRYLTQWRTSKIPKKISLQKLKCYLISTFDSSYHT